MSRSTAAPRAAIAALGRTPEPDSALANLVRILEAAEPSEAAAIGRELAASGQLRSRLLNLLGASDALADHLALFPEHWRVLLDDDAGTPTERITSAVAEDADNLVNDLRVGLPPRGGRGRGA